jgi:3-hydroxybutyryl-CoA dehydrogenase
MISMTTNARLHDIAVLGAGTMGSGIAQVAAQAGCSVSLQDISLDLAAKGKARIGSALEGQVAKGRMTQPDAASLLSRITPREGIEESVRGADLVIEAAPESLDLKLALFRRVAAAAPSGAILATNTSSLSITRLAQDMPHPERFIGLHFFNPPPVMKLLEIVRGAATSDEIVETCRSLAATWGKEPIVVKDSPGFASSRLGIALGLEAIRMLEEGVATAADIDKAMELGYRHPMGPLKLTDLVGLDVRLAIAEYLATELDDRRFAPPELLRAKVRDGHVGRKSGRGFYRWIDGEAQPE